MAASIEQLNPRDVELALTSSRRTLELGEPWEILLRVRNHSSLTVWLSAAATTLTLPAEVLHPAESRVASRGPQLPTVPGPGYDIVSIRPGGQYICTWRVNTEDEDFERFKDSWAIRRWHFFFHPGEYEIQAHVHVWTEEPHSRNLVAPRLLKNPQVAAQASSASLSEESASSGARELSPEEQLFEAKKLQCEVLSQSLPLSVTGTIDVTIKSSFLFGAAAFGGVLAFFFREFYRAGQGAADHLAWSDLYTLPMYVLTAIIIFLLVHRITEARFPLTVRIMDFWGATAFGVLAAFGGHAILDKVLRALP